MELTSRSTRFLPALLCLTCVLLAGCDAFDRPPAHVDISTPKSAAIAYLSAIRRADAPAARALTLGTADQKQWPDALVAMVDGMRSFDKALYARFGPMVDQLHTEMEDGIRALADQPLEAIADGELASDGEKARIDPHRSGFATRHITSLYLTREKYGWYVDLAKTYAEDVPPEKLSDVSAVFREYRKYGEAFRVTARDVLAKRFRSSDEAARVLGERIKAIADAEPGHSS